MATLGKYTRVITIMYQILETTDPNVFTFLRRLFHKIDTYCLLIISTNIHRLYRRIDANNNQFCFGYSAQQTIFFFFSFNFIHLISILYLIKPTQIFYTDTNWKKFASTYPKHWSKNELYQLCVGFYQKVTKKSTQLASFLIVMVYIKWC